jgi:putative ABC transport system ATP-binding protein
VSPRGDSPWRRDAPTRPEGPILIDVHEVHKVYQRGAETVHALRGVSFRLREGEITGLVGPSGSGKTTLLNLLCGWEAPDGGRVTWDVGRGTPLVDRDWSQVAILPQGLGLMEELTIRENVELPVHLSGDAAVPGPGASELIEELGLAKVADRAPREASLGEQQRAALARALVLEPRLVLADEPTTHQDARWARAALEVLARAARRGTCLLVATHNREAASVVDRTLAIRDGLVA